MTFRIGSVEIGGTNPCRFVAELGNAHNGSLGRAMRLIDAAKGAGADLVKFQCYLPDELVALRGDGPAPEPWGSQGWTMGALYEKAQTPHAWFPHLVEHCQSIGMPWFSSVFGEDSMRLLRSLDCPAYKIARLDNRHRMLAATARMAGKPVIVSRYNEYVPPIGAIEAAALLYCPPGYPQTSFGLRWDLFNDDSDAGNYNTVHTGFSFHGTDYTPCVVAATLGAKLIEAHFQLDDEPSELEADVSLTASQFAQMVRDVRKVEAMLA